MFYYLKTDLGEADYPVPYRKGHYFGLCEADSPEHAELRYKKYIATNMSRGVCDSNRTAAAKRMAAKDFEVAEFIPAGNDPQWACRIFNPKVDTR